MIYKKLILSFVFSATVLWGVAQSIKVASNAKLAKIETRISESRNQGKFTRTTESFHQAVLLSRKIEVSLKDDGLFDLVFTKLFRDGEMIYASTFNKAATNTIRSYYLEGRMVMAEEDGNGDQFFETTILFNANEQPLEAFSKSKDGSITQFSNENLDELKKTFGKLKP